jgi:chemotaxis response regulator CheB
MKIAIVNDLPLAAEALRRAVSLDAQHQVIWSARDGAEAVTLCARQKPDLILMDLIMPNMDGVAATRAIMASHPCQILLVTTNVGTNARLVFEAMACGALDAIDTPQFGVGDPYRSAAPLLKKIGNIEQRNRLALKLPAEPDKVASAVALPLSLVAIGASAGGPGALATLLAGLPVGLEAALIIVQHIDAKFVNGMADWLNQHSAIPVRLAQEGEQPQTGVVLLAGTSGHLVLSGAARLGYSAEPQDNAYRPSIDVFFHSVCQHWRGQAIGIILSGMGADGALGLKEMRDHGHPTMAQDQASSVVYGMPKAAAELGAAVDVLPVQAMASRLAGMVARMAASRRVS